MNLGENKMVYCKHKNTKHAQIVRSVYDALKYFLCRQLDEVLK